MQVSVEATSALERRLTVGVPSEDIDKEINKRLQQAAKTVQIKGFRKGKVPFKLVRQRFGAGVQREVLGDAINRTFQEAVREKELRLAGQPKIEARDPSPEGLFEYVATFEVYPEISLNSIDGIEVKRYTAEVTDSDVDEMIETLRKNQAKFQVKDGEAKEGDRVNIDFEGTKDGEAFDGGTAQGYNLVIGSKSMIPGFEDALIGMKPDEEKVVKLTFPADYQVDALKGAEAEFKVKMNSVSEKELPELNDDFFQNFGVSEGGVEKFRTEVRENMEREKENLIKAKIKTQVLDALLEKNPIETPRALVANEVQVLREQAMQQYGQLSAQIDIKSLLPDKLFWARAQKRTALGLLIADIVSRQQMKIDRDRLKSLIEGIASTYEDPESVVSYYYSNRDLLSSAEAAVLEDQVVDYLLESAVVQECAVTYQELVRAEEKAQAEQARASQEEHQETVGT